jgi:hypothetical protein
MWWELMKDTHIAQWVREEAQNMDRAIAALHVQRQGKWVTDGQNLRAGQAVEGKGDSG